MWSLACGGPKGPAQDHGEWLWRWQPIKVGPVCNLGESPGGFHFCFTKIIMDVVCRGVVQGDDRCNELLGGLESAKSLDQSLAVDSVEGLFEVEAKYCSTNTELILYTGFNPCAQCEAARGRFSDDLVVLAHPAVDSGKRIGYISLRKIGKLRHPCELGPDML